jgi:hypothetical protein
MSNCVLKNNKSTATKIFNGENKSVCAWIICDNINVVDKQIIEETNKTISFNPRVVPYWVSDGINVDDKSFSELFTVDTKIYVKDGFR